MSRMVTVGLVQMACGDDREATLARAEKGVRDCAARGARIVCLQELFATPYFCRTEDSRCFDLAEPVPGPTTDRMARLAKETDVALVVPVFERRGPGVYHNTAALIDAKGTLAGTYRKMHIPDDPGYYEKFYFAPGDLGVRVFDLAGVRVGVLICWDQWFPEAARLAALAGAQVLFYPTAIGWKPEERDESAAYTDAWKTSMRGHAIANGLYVCAVNRVGQEGELLFWGGSFICDPFGRVVAEAGDGPETLVADIDPDLVDRTRREWPFLRDRRIDAYGGLLRRYLDEP